MLPHVSIRIALALMAGIALGAGLPWQAHPWVWALVVLLCVLRVQPSRLRNTVIALLIGGLVMSMSERAQLETERNYSALLDDREGELLVGEVEGLSWPWAGRQPVSYTHLTLPTITE